jgi:diketogulonate reductase-like aldo/keto reductase
VKRKESWLALEKLYTEGKLRSIGVSNYTVRHLKELLSFCKIKPQINQVEFHPLLFQEELLNFCKENDIVITAYASLGEGHLVSGKSEEVRKITEMAERYKATPAQLLLRWANQLGMAVIPKSARLERIVENFNIFYFLIQKEDMEKLCSMSTSTRYCWDPTNVK